MRLTLFPGQRSSHSWGIASAVLLFLTGCIPCRDGLDQSEWQARERARAAASLPRARQRLIDAMDSAWAIRRPADLIDELRFIPDEQFDLGGLHGFGGPYYAHSCIDRQSDPPSWFLLHHVRAALTPDSLLIMTGWMTADDTTWHHAGRMGPRLESRALSLREVTDANLRVFRDTLRISLSCTPSSAMCFSRLPVARADSSAGQAFTARLLSSARRLRAGKREPR
jgi:hypothetical protein